MPKYVLNSLLAGIFSVTFTASPYVYAADKTQKAKAEQKSPIVRLKEQFKEAKLTTTKSYPEFFMRLSKQNKNVNPYVFKQIAETMATEKYPNTQVQEFTYKGKDALKVMTQVGKEQVVIEYLFNGSEVMKINGILFKTADTRTAEAFDARLKTVPAFHKVYQDFQKRVFKTALIPTYKQWTKLTKGQRAEYYMRYRMLLEAAYKVHGTGPFKVVTDKYKTFEEWAQATFFGSEAYANNVGTSNSRVEAEAVAKAKTLRDSMGNPAPFVDANDPSGRGPSCIVAGYARQWKGATCPWDGGSAQGREQFYRENPTSVECRSSKGNGWVACNPLIYGFSSTGSPHCINANDKAQINIATHGVGPCEGQSPLKSPGDKMAFIKGILKREDIPGADTLKCKDAQGNKKDTCAEGDTLITTNKALFDKIMGELSGPIGQYIESAKKICEESEGRWNYKAPNPPGGSSKRDPAYQDEACDALMKRAIAVQNLLTVDDTNPPVLGGPCDGWSPADQVQEITNPDGSRGCGCKPVPECQQDTAARTCNPPAAPAVYDEVTEVTSEKISDGYDCTSYFSRMNPASSCSSTGADWFKTIFGAIAAVCAGNYFFKGDLFGICEKSDHKHRSRTASYVDPVAPCPATGCPETPTDPENPTDPEEPRAEEEEVTNQNNPVYNPIQVPPR